MKRLLWVFLFVGLFGKLSYAQIKATDLSGCEPAIASYEPADIPLEKYVSHLATANIVSNRKFAEFIRDFPDILQDKPLRRYPELQGQWDILWDRVRKKQLENLSELLTHLKQPEPSDEDRRINGHENTELFADEAPVDAGNWIEDRINELDQLAESNNNERGELTIDDPHKEIKERTITLLMENPEWKAKDLASTLEISIKKIRRFIEELQKEGQLTYRGSGWSGRWQVLTEEQEIADHDDSQKYDPHEWNKKTIVALLGFNPKMTIQDLADKTNIGDYSHIVFLIEELEKEERIGWIDDSHDGIWVVLNKQNYNRWIYLKVSDLLTRNPEMTTRELADTTGIPYTKVFQIVKKLRKTKVLALLIENPEMTKQELADTLNLSVVIISSTIEELKTEKRLKSKDNGIGGYWLVFDKKGNLISSNPKEKKERAILTLFAENPELTTQELATKFGLKSNSTLSPIIQKLKETGQLRRIGGRSNTGYWEVFKKGTKPQDYDLNEQRKKTALKLFKENPYITRKNLAAKLGVSISTLQIIIAKLKDESLLLRVGNSSSGYWEVLEEASLF